MISCKESNQNVKKIYSEEGSLVEMYEYNDYNKDSTTYILHKYYEDGSTEAIVPIVKGKINGLVEVFYPDSKIWLIRRYKNGKYHGVTYEYNENLSYLEKEILYLNGNQVVSAEYGKTVDSDTLFGYTVFYPNKSIDTSFWPVGSVIWDLEGNIIKKYKTYYTVEADDTLQFGKVHEVTIDFSFGLYENLSFELFLGEIDNNFDFIDSSQITTYKSDRSILSFEIDDYSIGSNLILGKIKMLKNEKNITSDLLPHPQMKEYIFYHQFYVQ